MSARTPERKCEGEPLTPGRPCGECTETSALARLSAAAVMLEPQPPVAALEGVLPNSSFAFASRCGERGGAFACTAEPQPLLLAGCTTSESRSDALALNVYSDGGRKKERPALDEASRTAPKLQHGLSHPPPPPPAPTPLAPPAPPADPPGADPPPPPAPALLDSTACSSPSKDVLRDQRVGWPLADSERESDQGAFVPARAEAGPRARDRYGAWGKSQ